MALEAKKTKRGRMRLPPRRHQVLVDKAHEEDVRGNQLGESLLKTVKGGLEVGKNHHAP